MSSSEEENNLYNISSKEVSPFVIDYNNESRDVDIGKKLRKYGVCVITNVFTREYMERSVESIVSSFESINTGIDREDNSTWSTFNTPPQPKPGMYQALMTNLPTIWSLKTNYKIEHIFRQAYSRIRDDFDENEDQLVVTSDGFALLPNGKALDNGKDWAHIDQTYGDIYKCIQGQIVLSDTTAGIRVSPKSHKYFTEVLELNGINTNDDEKVNKSNWCKIKDIKATKKLIKKGGGRWQVPIRAPKGSVILWLSSLIHSNILPYRVEETSEDPWLGWRCVIYVCYRPKKEFTNAQVKKLEKTIRANRVTNHWGMKMFAKKPGDNYWPRRGSPIERNDILNDLLENPIDLYELLDIDVDYIVDRFYSVQE